ncbi:glutamate-rich protein 2 isoform 4-T5 [Hipposideros larvatus]
MIVPPAHSSDSFFSLRWFLHAYMQFSTSQRLQETPLQVAGALSPCEAHCSLENYSHSGLSELQTVISTHIHRWSLFGFSLPLLAPGNNLKAIRHKYSLEKYFWQKPLKFLRAEMGHDYHLAKKLCQMILLYEPENPEAKEFFSLIEEMLLMEETQNLEEDDQDSEEDSSSESNGESEALSEESSDECEDG